MAAPVPTLPSGPSTGGVGVRLPWWAVALPAVAFAVLLLMIVGPDEARAATADPALGRLFARVLSLLTG
ncbi:hypothetical protein [Streptomyces sp. NPDC052042]|uniref:hypothetical protein n=1 Tax=Streptomyces sp. NPDC052042 TaxID=3365683 RepID=UPI0037D2D59B